MSVAAPTGGVSASAKTWGLPVGVVATLAAASAYTAWGNPYQAGFAPSCIFYSATGWYCPGCGGLRATHELLHGDVAAALALNPLVTLVVIPGVLLGLAWWFAAIAGKVPPVTRISTRVAWAVPLALAVFWVVRNLPGMEFLRP